MRFRALTSKEMTLKCEKPLTWALMLQFLNLAELKGIHGQKRLTSFEGLSQKRRCLCPGKAWNATHSGMMLTQKCLLLGQLWMECMDCMIVVTAFVELMHTHNILCIFFFSDPQNTFKMRRTMARR